MAKTYYGTASLFDEAMKENAGYQTWYDAIMGSFNTQAAQTQASASYDISQAYANYKKQALQLQQSNLGTGFKKYAEGDLKSDYASAYSQIQGNLYNNLAKLQENADASVDELDKQFAQYGETAQKLYDEYIKFASQNYEGYSDLIDSEGNVNWDAMTTAIGNKYGEDKEGLGLYTTGLDAEGNRTYTSTALGDMLLGMTLNDERFANQLRGSSPELYNALMENPELYKRVIGGDAATKWSTYTTDDIKAARDEELNKYYRDYANANITKTDAIKTLYGENMENLTTAKEPDLKALNDAIYKNKNVVATVNPDTGMALSRGEQHKISELKTYGTYTGHEITDNQGNTWKLDAEQYQIQNTLLRTKYIKDSKEGNVRVDDMTNLVERLGVGYEDTFGRIAVKDSKLVTGSILYDSKTSDYYLVVSHGALEVTLRKVTLKK